MQVRIGSTLSDLYDQEQGVPQGSILSTTLFNIKINNIVNCLDNKTDGSLYVDDFGICYRSKNMVGGRVVRWLWVNFQLYGFTWISNTSCCIVIFDRKLSFIPHIRYIKAKCLKALNLLRVLSSTSWGADRTTLLHLYRSLIRSKLDYGSIVYGSARKSYLQMLETINHQGLRLALGAFRTSPVTSLYAEADEPSLHLRREKLSLQYATRLAANPSNPASTVTFSPQFPDIYECKPKTVRPFGLRVLPLLESSKINPKNIEKQFITDIPSWCIRKPNI